MQAQLEAEKLAWAQQQKDTGSVLDPMTKARAAGAAIGDVVLRKKHGSMLDSAARFVGLMTEVPAAGAHVGQRLSGAAAGLVCETKKATADAKMRKGQVMRGEKHAAQAHERQEGWNQNHLANQKPQVKWQKLSRKHAVAKKKNRLEQKERRGRGGGGRGRGDGWDGGWGGRGGRGRGRDDRRY